MKEEEKCLKDGKNAGNTVKVDRQYGKERYELRKDHNYWSEARSSSRLFIVWQERVVSSDHALCKNYGERCYGRKKIDRPHAGVAQREGR